MLIILSRHQESNIGLFLKCLIAVLDGFVLQKKPQRSAIKQVIISFVNKFGQLMNANEPNLKTKGGWKQMIDLNQRPK